MTDSKASDEPVSVVPTDADLYDACYRQLQEICELRAEITGLKADRRRLYDLQQQSFALERANAKWRQKYPDPDKEPLAELMKLVPSGIVSLQAVNKWCEHGTLDAQKVGGRWRVNPSSFWTRVEATAKRKGVSFKRANRRS